MSLVPKKKATARATKTATHAAKKITKTAAKNAYGAATRSARATTQAANSAASHGSAWAKDTAKLYQLPFATKDMEAAGKEAAAKFQNTADSMMKMGADAMQQFWSQAQAATKNPEKAFSHLQGKSNDVFGFASAKLPKFPGFDASAFKMPGFDSSAFKMPGFDNSAFKPEEMVKKFENVAKEASQSWSKASKDSGSALNEVAELSRENAQALVEVSNIAISILKEIGAESINYANKTFSQNVEISKEALTCRTLNDIFDLAGRLTKANLDSFFSQSVKISEMLFQGATEVSEPLNERVSESAERLSKAIAA